MDLNADTGEGFDDRALFPFLTSVNVACGGHAGDEATMEKTLRDAARHGLSLGAHPSYEDRANFGRVDLDLNPETVEVQVRVQIERLLEVARKLGLALSHVKPHGALYNRAARHLETALAIARTAKDLGLSLVGLPDSRMRQAAQKLGIRFIPEGFADRRYLADGSLCPRSRAGSVLTDPAEAAGQALALARGLPIPTAEGDELTLEVETLCIHSDSPGAAAIAAHVHASLAAEGLVRRAPLSQ